MLKQQAMNWKQIKKDCPKAWELLRKAHSTIEAWGYIDHPDVWDMDGLELSHNETRHLFDFFDDMGVFICILPAFSGWDWEVYVDDEWIDSSDIKNENRKEAEEEAFKRAFFILEKP